MKPQSSFKKILAGFEIFFLVLVLLSPIFLNIKTARAQSVAADAAATNLDDFKMTEAVTGKMPAVSTNVIKDIEAAKNEAQRKIEKKTDSALAKAAKVAFKTALGNFLNNLAYETAVWVGSGGEGESPMFVTEGWSAYLVDGLDNFAGNFIDNLNVAWSGGEFSAGKLTIKSSDNKTTYFKLDICTPDLNTQLSIYLGLGLKEYESTDSRCKVSKLFSNWSDALEDVDFLKDYQIHMLESDPMGIFLEVTTAYMSSQQLDYQVNMLKRMQSNWKDVECGKDGKICTPGDLVSEYVYQALVRNGTKREESYVSDPVADAIGVFTNTLIGTVLQRLVNGLVSNDSDSSDTTSVYQSSAVSTTKGAAAAKERFASLREVPTIVGGPYDILNKLTACNDANNPGPTDCVLDEKFRFAIEKGLTVKQALAEGWLDGKKPFGFETAQGGQKEPDYKNGYPYRSFVILRKYRILPVGWEIAAEYIKKYGGRTFSLAEVVGASDSSSQYYNNSDLLSLRGLVDPNWVLKAPEVYCRREGPGPKLVSSTVTSGSDANGDGDYEDDGDTPPQTQISREDYCSDEQSCIIENEDGSCKYYGYCTQERGTYNFGRTSQCDAQYNSCQTFKNSAGQTVSYLKNSLAWSNCSVGDSYGTNGVAGCRQYAVRMVNGVWQNTDENNKYVFLDNDAKACDSGSEGCHEFIRLKPGLGTNLLPNNSFEYYQNNNGAITFSGWKKTDSQATFAIETSNLPLTDSSVAAVIKSSPTAKNTATQSCQVLTSSFSNIDSYVHFLPGRYYRLSFWAKANQANSDWYAHFSYGSQAQNFSTYNGENKLNLTDQWQQFTTNVVQLGAAANAGDINFNFSDCKAGTDDNAIHLDGLFLEEISGPSSEGNILADYGNRNLLYLRQPPAYYQCNDLTADGKLNTANDAAQCSNYAQACTVNDVGCQLYTPVNGDPAVSAIVQTNDICPAECNGYKTYFEQNTTFAAGSYQQLIPNGQTCTAAAAGCDEFTNLDQAASGGEVKEYYTSLKLCQKPDAATDATYYTWEGSDTAGYQLKTYRLRKSDTLSNEGYAPCTNLRYSSASISTCNEDGLSLSCDPTSDSDCREFFDVNGHSFKRKLSLTVTSSDDCHPYRRTVKSQSDCSGKNTTTGWSGVAGWWNGNECIYQAIPNQGVTCKAAENGCRQYKGNAANNVKYVLQEDFEEANQLTGWSASGSGAGYSSEAIIAGGHSFKTVTASNNAATITYTVPANAIAKDKTYYLNIAVKGRGAVSVYFNSLTTAGFSGEELAKRTFTYNPYASNKASRTLNNDTWQQYVLGPVNIDWTLPQNDQLVFAFAGTQANLAFYLDNVSLREVPDSVYQIKDSWNIPVSCDNALDNSTGSGCDGSRCYAGYMLGCQQYKDSDSVDYYIKSFSHLCPASAAGCEALIDTQDSVSPFAETKSLFNGATVVSVPADKISYWVNNKASRCDSSNVGCQAVGEKQYLTDWTDQNYYQTVYKTILPDKANEAYCALGQFRCDKFTSGSDTYYFHNPLNTATTTGPSLGRACEYITKSGETSPNWWQRDANNNLVRCDSYLTSSPNYTIGYSGNPITQPLDDFSGYAGVCPADQNQCTEFIEPQGLNSGNLVFNSDFSQTSTENCLGVQYGVASSCFDGWQVTAGVGNNKDMAYAFNPNSYSQGNELAVIENFSVPKFHVVLSVDNYESTAMSLQANTLYTVSLSVKAAGGAGTLQVKVPGSDLLSPDGSMANDGTGVVFTVSKDTNNSNAYQKYSGRFYTKKDGSVKLSLKTTGGSFLVDNVRLAPTGVYYAKADKVDASSCNGVVNPTNGCVLFNNRQEYSMTRVDKLFYDSDQSPDGADANGNGTAQTCSGATCDSNTLLKVTPDRTCNTWLYCKTAVKAKERTDNVSTFDRVKDQCLEVGLCQAVDDKGNCSQVVDNNLQVTQYNKNSADELKNFSGYSQPGFNNSIAGYLPYEKMTQFGEVAELTNGDFEQTSAAGQPIGWYPAALGTCSGSGVSCLNSYACSSSGKSYTPDGCVNNLAVGSWSADYFRTIYDPKSLAKEGITALSGRSVLKVNAKYRAISENIEVYPNTDYILTGYANTLNLNPKEANAVVSIGEFTSTGERALSFSKTSCVSNNSTLCPATCNDNSCKETWIRRVVSDSITKDYPADSRGYYSGSYIQARQDWTPFTVRLHTSSNTGYLRLELNSWVSTDKQIEGSSYFDNLRLRPALKVDNSSLIASSCRLYPASDASACDYSSDGITYRGQKGYCLQYDTKNANICLQWWPIDLLKGELTGSMSAGYAERSPLYYCTSGLAERKYEYRHTYFLCNAGNDDDCGCGNCANGYTKVQSCHDDNGGSNDKNWCSCVPTPSSNDPLLVSDDSSDAYIAAGCKDGGCCENNATMQKAIYYGTSANDGWYNYNGISDFNSSYPVKVSSNNSSDTSSYNKYATELCGGSVSCILSKEPYRTKVKCIDLVQVVTPSGSNKAWAGRINAGSEYAVPISQISSGFSDITYSSDYKPFGSMLPPSPTDNPQKWDSDTGTTGNQALYEKVPSKTATTNYARAGTVYNCVNPTGETQNCQYVVDESGSSTFPYGYYAKPVLDSNASTSASLAINLIKRLFAYSYGRWLWDETNNYYNPQAGSNWTNPSILCEETQCGGGVNCQRDFKRPDYNSDNRDYCAIAPQVTNVTVNGKTDNISFNALSQTVSLQFNVSIDANQWPMTAYKVDWGDGSVTAVSGVALRDASNSNDPIVLYHTYSYYSMQKYAQNGAVIKIQVRDNWGWCNGNLTDSGTSLKPEKGEWGYYQNACSSESNAWQIGPTVKLNK